ncbi:MAG: hypothetical protein GX633_09250, partial [Clostridiales bacterium]|nr:hypothetical protein [Clostridiales bacterium]
IMTGMVMGKQDIIKILKAPKAYIASLIRLVLLPMLIGVILLILNVRHDIVLVAIMTTAMPMGLNSVVFPEAFGGDSDTGAQVCLVSNLMGILTIPIIGMLASLL